MMSQWKVRNTFLSLSARDYGWMSVSKLKGFHKLIPKFFLTVYNHEFKRIVQQKASYKWTAVKTLVRRTVAGQDDQLTIYFAVVWSNTWKAIMYLVVETPLAIRTLPASIDTLSHHSFTPHSRLQQECQNDISDGRLCYPIDHVRKLLSIYETIMFPASAEPLPNYVECVQQTMVMNVPPNIRTRLQQKSYAVDNIYRTLGNRTLRSRPKIMVGLQSVTEVRLG